MLVAPDHIFIARTDDAMRRAIDARSGTGSAASRPAAIEAAKALDAVGALSMVSSSSPATTDFGGKGSTTTVPRSGEPAALLFVGSRLNGPQADAFLVAVKSSADDATGAATNLRTLVENGEALTTFQPWKERLTPIDIGTDGNVLTATFATPQPRIIVEALFKRENLTDL